VFRKKNLDQKPTMWVATSDLPQSPADDFYTRLDQILTSIGFGETARKLSEPYYCMDASKGGTPGIDPEVYFKMIMVGFFENIDSDRGIARRCSDSISIRTFLHYELTESTPVHSSLTVIRKRIPLEVHQQLYGLILAGMKKHGLIKGKRVGVDTSVISANAAMRSLHHRMSGEDYRKYVKRLAAEAGVDPNDAAAVTRFDRKRKKKTSNDDWQNPHDPDAKIGPTKQGTTRLIYKPEHVVDLDTGAILDADVLPGDVQDKQDMAERLLDAEERINVALGNEQDEATINVVVEDKGYYSVKELASLHEVGIRTVISDPITNRRLDKLTANHLAAVRSAKRSCRAKYGKELTKRRGMYVERSFAHTLAAPKATRTTMRGMANVKKRHILRAMCANLSLVMRKVFGHGTAKQAIAAADILIIALMTHCWTRMMRRKAINGIPSSCRQMFRGQRAQEADVALFVLKTT
jgi:transposase